MINITEGNYKKNLVMFVVRIICRVIYNWGSITQIDSPNKTLLIKFNLLVTNFNQDINGMNMDRAIIDYFIDELTQLQTF
jgi:hypothetical protein